MTFKQADNPTYWHKWTLVIIAALLCVRLTALFLSPLNLHGDEAQYWAWSKDLDWGFFTKPPLIAVVIWSTTSVFGDAEWAVRLSSAPLHAVTSYVIFCTARALFDARVGFWAALIYGLMPAVWLSSQIVSTDVSLLLCYAVALNGWVHLRNGGGWGRAVQMGLAIGLGLLAKYAMLFFLPALVFAITFDAQTRRALLSLMGVLIAVLAAGLLAPNMMWNLSHDFATLSHTAANANMGGGGIPFHPLELLEFFSSQFGVFGPISFALMLGAAIFALRGKARAEARYLAVFALTPLLAICVQALLSRANANWAVTTYVAGSILTAYIVVTYWPRARAWLGWGVTAQGVIGAAFLALMLSPTLTNALGAANSVKHVRAWPQTVTALEGVMAQGHEGQPFTAVALDKRIIYYDMVYYGLGETLPLYMWMYRAAPENHAELTAPLPATDGPVLLINYYGNYEAEIREDFTRIVRLPPLDIDLGGGKRRTLKLWAGYGYTPTQTR